MKIESPHIDPADTVGLVVISLLVVLGSARLTRLLIFDSYPPSVWLRIQWDNHTSTSPWNALFHCAYCLAPWIALTNGIVGLMTDYATWWIVINTWLAVSYLAAIVVAYDGDD